MLKTLTIITTGCALLALPVCAQDVPGVTVDLGGATVMHRSIVLYPQDLVAKHVQGTVNVQVALDAKGNVTDAQVLSGPVELRRSVLESVLQWHFARSSGSTRQVAVTFQTPADGGIGVVDVAPTPSSQSIQISAAPPAGVIGGILSSGSAGQIVGTTSLPGADEPRQLANIQLSGFNEQLKSELLAALPVHLGDMVTRASLPAISAAARQYDEHLSVSMGWNRSGVATLQITAPGVVRLAAASTPQAPVDWPGIRVAGNVQSALVINKVMPEYPPIARQARIQDHVILNVQIGQDGTVQQLAVASGHPLLRQAAMDAVRQWLFKPTLLNGQPVQVVSQVDLNFSLRE